jgi:FAD/FMN-containing dehydrogenase
MTEGLVAALHAVVGRDAVVTDPGVMAAHEVDWTGRFRGRAVAVVRPGSAAEVGEVLLACGAAGVGVVPQGGNTSLVAAAVPHDAVVLSTARLDALGQVDVEAAEVTAGAGVTLERVQSAAGEAGLAFGVDLAARGSATVGGMIATDAGGIHGLRYGSMRRQVVALEAVLADGSVVRELPGRDLVGLLAGSEGTLAVVTEARLRLVPAWPHRATALVSVDDIADAIAAAEHARDHLSELDAVELIDAASLGLAAARAGQSIPFAGTGPALLVETAGDRPMLDELSAALSTMPGLRDAVAADDGPGRRRLWALREGITESIATVGIPHKLDVGLPLGGLAAFAVALGPTVEAAHPGARVFIFGHLALGNLHVNVVGPAPDDETVDDAVLRLVAAHGGQVAAEHGIGRAKARWLTLARSPEELSLHASIKRTLDPRGVLNPGVLDLEAIDGSSGNSDTMTRN